jgi:hypothetical protein
MRSASHLLVALALSTGLPFAAAAQSWSDQPVKPEQFQDDVVISYEDGSEVSFRVVARVTYEKDELPLEVIFSREGPPVLTLITCGGGFNSNIARYDSNIVVYAVPDSGDGTTPGDRL